MKHSETRQWTNVVTQQKNRIRQICDTAREAERQFYIPHMHLKFSVKGKVLFVWNIVKLSQNNDRNKLESTELCAKRAEDLNVSMDSLIIQAHK